MENGRSIPIVYCTLSGGKLHTGSVVCDGGRYVLGETVPVSSVSGLKYGKERGKVLVADVGGLNRRRFNPGFIEHCKVSGNELWLIEPVYDEYDVLDGFIGNADKIVFPYEFIKNDSVLPEILEVSDNCIPLLNCRNGFCGKKPVPEAVRHLSENGFRNIMVADTDGTVNPDCWNILYDECGGLIGYSPRKPLENGGRLYAKDLFPITFQ